MIKIIVLKDADNTKGIVFAKALVQTDAISFEVAVGMVKKTKGMSLKAGDLLIELPMSVLSSISVKPINVAKHDEEPVLIPFISLS